MSEHLSRSEAHRAIRRWYAEALQTVDPRGAVRRAVAMEGGGLVVNDTAIPLMAGARVVAVALGKAASDMAAALDEILGDRLESGVILTKDGHLDGAPARWKAFEAAHPIPDERGVEATRHIPQVVGSLGKDDVLIVLVSGGGSALLELPSGNLNLTDIQAVTGALLRAGAPIQDLNAVRSELSEVKGGGLRRMAVGTRCVSLILSDVLGNDPAVIASGPTIVRQPNPRQALELIHRYGIRDSVPSAVLSHLEQAVSAPRQPVDALDDVFAVVGDNEQFVQGVAEAAERDGLSVSLAMPLAEGEARDLAVRFLAISDSSDSDVVLGGGEATVTVRGDGIGGRNTEFALQAAMLLDGSEEGWGVCSLASDGQDGSVDAAGAIADGGTLSRGRVLGLDADDYLSRNDSGSYFERLGDLVVPGPTGTNVNDVFIAVRTAGDES